MARAESNFTGYDMHCLRDKPQEIQQELLKTIPKTDRPTSIDDFGYYYTDDGKLRQKATDQPFAWMGQKHYDALGDCIVKDIQKIMVENLQKAQKFKRHTASEYGFKEMELGPSVDIPDTPRTNIFLSPDALQKDKLLLIIQGSGAVRPGMWARALCINNSLNEGTIFNYLEQGKELDYGMIVLNPNNNNYGTTFDDIAPRQKDTESIQEYWIGARPNRDSKMIEKQWNDDWKKYAEIKIKAGVPIVRHEEPEIHTLTVWDNIVSEAAAKDINIVAHSYAGWCVLTLLEQRWEQVSGIVRGVAFTDAVHQLGEPLSSIGL
eukprot:gene19097-920_t